MSLILLLLSGTALANGQTTHLWITETARTHLPAGELADLLTGQSDVLRVGTMFPDGGYAIGHGYGEVAHWEPFQGLLRDWILDNFDDPTGTDAAPYVAFYLGLASHGMADQVFDSMYRSAPGSTTPSTAGVRRKDPWTPPRTSCSPP